MKVRKLAPPPFKLRRLSAFDNPLEIASQLVPETPLFVSPTELLEERLVDFDPASGTVRPVCSDSGRQRREWIVAEAVQLTRLQAEKILMRSSRGRLVITMCGEPEDRAGTWVALFPASEMVVFLRDLWVPGSALERLGVSPAAPRLANESQITPTKHVEGDGVFEKLLRMFIYQHNHTDRRWSAAGNDESRDVVAERFWVFISKARSDFRNGVGVHINDKSARQYLALALGADPAAASVPASFRLMAAVLRSSFDGWPAGTARVPSAPKSFEEFRSFANQGDPLTRIRSAKQVLFEWKPDPLIKR